MRFVTCIVRECQLWLYGHVARFPDADPAHQILSANQPTMCLMVAAGWWASQRDGDGSGICLGDGWTEAPGVPAESVSSDTLLRRMLPYLTWPGRHPQNHIMNINFDPKFTMAMIEATRFLKSTSYDEISPNLEEPFIILQCTTLACGLQEDAANLQIHEPRCGTNWLTIYNLMITSARSKIMYIVTISLGGVALTICYRQYGTWGGLHQICIYIYT